MKEKNSKGTLHLRNDIILIASLLVISAIAFVYLFFLRKQGNTVTVTVDGKVYATYSLQDNVTEDIVTGRNGENHNIFVIKEGKVYMESATCPDGICVRHRPVFRDGESIVCLPNGVVVTVTDESDKASPDIVV